MRAQRGPGQSAHIPLTPATRAEADRVAAARRATEDRAIVERLRAELEQLRIAHHAHTAQAVAERDAREHRRRATHQTELRAQADDAAEQALAEVEAVRAETTETIARVTEQTDAAVAEHQQRAEQAAGIERTTREELERVRTDATAAVAAAREDAAQHRRDTEAERDRVIAERDLEARRQIEQTQLDAAARIAAAEQAAQDARAEARIQVLAAQQQAVEAGSAHTRAEADKAAAERRATDDRATLDRLRAEIEQLRTEHHQELAAARREAADERAALRREASEQLTAVLARFDTTTPARRGPRRGRWSDGGPARPRWAAHECYGHRIAEQEQHAGGGIQHTQVHRQPVTNRVLGEGLDSYARRLARANHLRPSYLTYVLALPGRPAPTGDDRHPHLRLSKDTQVEDPRGGGDLR